MMKNIKQLWNDPVWSNVIAGIIVAMILGCVAFLWKSIGHIIIYLSKMSFELLSHVVDFISLNFFVILSVVLIGVVAFLLLIIYRFKKQKNVPSNTALDWFNSQIDEHRYIPALLWFPVNRTLITPRYFTDSESLSHVPEIVDLIKHKALRIRTESAVQYSLQIDRDLYGLIEKELHADDIPMEGKELLEHLRQVDFLSLFPRRRL